MTCRRGVANSLQPVFAAYCDKRLQSVGKRLLTLSERDAVKRREDPYKDNTPKIVLGRFSFV